jgi:streptogramin lyase
MKIDPATNQVVETIPIRVAPFDLAVDGDTLWVIAFDNNQVARVDTGSKQVVTTIQNVDEPTGIAVANGEVWAIEHSGRNLVRIDPGTNAIVSKTEIARWDNFKLPRPTNVVFDSGSLWVPTNFGQSVVRIDPASLVQTVIPFPGMRPQRAATGCGSIWIAVDASNEDPTESMIARIDPATNTSQTWRFFGARNLACHEGVLWVLGSNPDENGTWRLYQIEWNG